jgi:hypothetical protein
MQSTLFTPRMGIYPPRAWFLYPYERVSGYPGYGGYPQGTWVSRVSRVSESGGRRPSPWPWAHGYPGYDGYPQGTYMGIPGIRWVSDGYPTGIPRVSRPWLGTGRYKLGKGTKKRREMIVCFITHLIKHGSADHRRKQKPFCLDRPIKACAAVFLGGPLLPDSANILSSSRTRTIITTRAIDHREAPPELPPPLLLWAAAAAGCCCLLLPCQLLWAALGRALARQPILLACEYDPYRCVPVHVACAYIWPMASRRETRGWRARFPPEPHLTAMGGEGGRITPNKVAARHLETKFAVHKYHQLGRSSKIDGAKPDQA